MIALHLIKTTVGATWALRQIKSLVQLGVVVHVVLPADDGLAASYREVGALVHIINVDIGQLKNPFSFLVSVLKLRRLVLMVRPDVIHSHFVGTTLFMRIALRHMDIPRIFQVPGPLHLENGVIRFLEIASANHHDYWIATCNRTRRYYLESGVSPDRVSMIFYGTDTSRYVPGVKGYLRSELGISPNTKIVGMVAFAYPPKRWLGRARGIKGHEDLIDAMVLVSKKVKDSVCVIVGGPWGSAHDYFDELVAYGRGKLGGRIFFLGTRHDVPLIYPDFDLAVHPSLSENLGGAGESLLMAIPTLATNVGGFPDIVIDGETGWLTEPSSPQNMAAKIVEILADPAEAKKRAVAGRNMLLGEVDAEKTSRDVFVFYKNILGVLHNA